MFFHPAQIRGLQAQATLSCRYESGSGSWPVLLDTRLMHRLRAVRRENRVPEVVIKVISAGSSALDGDRAHFEDLQNGRHRTLAA
jgi:hypothetical protein